MFITLVQLKNSFYRFKLLFFTCIFFSSCAYFNTFYNAKDSFNKAIKIIENNTSKNFNQKQNLSNTEKKLLYESISSSAIVIDKYSDSKYVDDAIYYTARAYFSLNENYKSDIYFNKLISNYPNSEYYLESLLWLEYNHLKMGLIDSSYNKTLKIEKVFKDLNSTDKELYYLLYNLKGEILISLKDYDNAFIEFEKSLEFSNSKSKKISMYSKLVTISEQENELERAIEYLNEIQLVTTKNDIKIESFKKWIDINKKLKKYQSIIEEIEKNILKSEFQTPKLQDELNLELASSYMKINNHTLSKNLFNVIIENSSQKKIKAQAYYWLGYISLMYEFEIGLAKEYFELVTETMRSSKFSKKSKLLLNEIDEYNKIISEYNFLKDNKLEMQDTLAVNQNLIPNDQSFNDQSEKDSLLFIIAEKLYFDFNQIDLSIRKHNDLIELFPESIYSIRSNKIIKQLNGKYNQNSDINSLDTVAIMRDNAWDIIDKKNLKASSLEAVKLLKDIGFKYNDFYSYYSLGIIYGDYLFLPDSSISYYAKGLRICDNSIIRSNLINKMLLLKESINTSLLLDNQKLNYLKAVNFIRDDFNLDSANLYLEKNLNNNQNHKKSSNFNDLIIDFQKKTNDIKDEEDIDSTIFYLANFSYFVFNNKELSKNLIQEIKETSDYYNLSQYLSQKINDEVTFFPDSVNLIFDTYKKLKVNFITQYNIKDSLIYYIDINKELLNLFPEEMVDTLKADKKRKNFNYKNDLNLNYNLRNDIMQDIKY